MQLNSQNIGENEWSTFSLVKKWIKCLLDIYFILNCFDSFCHQPSNHQTQNDNLVALAIVLVGSSWHWIQQFNYLLVALLVTQQPWIAVTVHSFELKDELCLCAKKGLLISLALYNIDAVEYKETTQKLFLFSRIHLCYTD